MYYAIEALTYLFDMIIIIIYMNGIFHKENRRTAYPLYIACFLIMEVLIYVNQALCTELPSKQFTIATSTVSLLTTFALTFLYRTRLSNRIFVSISFQILALLGESFFLFLVKIINPAVIELPLRQLSILMNLGSKIMLFLLILVVIFFWNRHIKYHDYKYNLLLFTTPVLSLVITLCIPVRSNYQSNNAYYMIIAYFAIALLNILNYCLLDNCFKMEQIKDENLSMRRQIDFQQEKYFQLGTAYKKTRSIVHDMKNHYFAISEMLKQQQTEQLDAYLHSAINDIEANYISVNSGNLVLDAFISNFEMLAKEKQFAFSQKITLQPTQIPVSDYDLCTIVGNMLDNASEAVCKSRNPNRYVHFNVCISENNTFVIHMRNTCLPEDQIKKYPDHRMNHGYGLANIKIITEKYHGFMRSQYIEDSFETMIVIPILNRKRYF